MKKSILSFTVATFIGSLALLSGCEEEPITPTEIPINVDRFLGSYATDDICGSDSSSYTISITASTSQNGVILISNLANTFDNNPVEATVTDSVTSSFTIAKQEPDNDDYFVEGSGDLINDSTITMSYTVTTPSGTPTACNSTSIRL